MTYNNPYLNMMPAVQQALAQQQQLLANPLLNPQQPTGQPVDFVTKDEFNKLLEENQKLREQLDREITQRADVEFFRKEQEVLKLEEGRKALQEVDYQKAKYFDMLWKTSPIGKETIQKYRDTIEFIYNKYTGQMQPATQAVSQQEATQEQKVEEPPKKYNVVNKTSQSEDVK